MTKANPDLVLLLRRSVRKRGGPFRGTCSVKYKDFQRPWK